MSSVATVLLPCDSSIFMYNLDYEEKKERRECLIGAVEILKPIYKWHYNF